MVYHTQVVWDITARHLCYYRSLGTSAVAGTRVQTIIDWILKKRAQDEKAAQEHWEEIQKSFKVVHSSACIGNEATMIIESRDCVDFSVPAYKADAEVHVPSLRWGEVYTVGWVQAVTKMVFRNSYPNGYLSWKFLDLEKGLVDAVCDVAVERRRAPWYEKKVKLRGPSAERIIHLKMEDFLESSVPWSFFKLGEQPHTLQKVHRDQTFKSWVVLKDEKSGKFATLDGYGWQAAVNISVNCSMPVGSRATLKSPLLQRQPWKLGNLHIPECALRPPIANEEQRCVWLEKQKEEDLYQDT